MSSRSVMAWSVVARFTVALELLLGTASTVLADDQRERAPGFCDQWDVSFWGLSNHLDHPGDYEDINPGVGVRCDARPASRVLGRNPDNHFFLEFDAMVNSYRGLLVPASFGAAYQLRQISGHCHVSAEAAVTVSYYSMPSTNGAQFRWGPVPGLGLGCGRVEVHVSFVPSPSRQVLAAIGFSATINAVRKRPQ